MISSCSGALLCSLLSKSFLRENRIISITDTMSFAVTPLDVAKTRLQAQQKRLALNTSFVNCPNGKQLLRTHSTHYTGMIVRTVCILRNRISFLFAFKFNMKSLAYGEFFVMFTKRDQDAFFKIGRHEGVTSLWSGLSPTLVLAVPTTICYFVTYEEIRRFLKDFHLKRNPGKKDCSIQYSIIWPHFIRNFHFILL